MKEKNTENHSGFSRRNFIRGGAAAAAGFMIVPRHVLGRGFVAPSDKLVIAGVGAGGKGNSDIRMFHESGNAEIAFLCDVDDRQRSEEHTSELQSLMRTS